MNLLSMFKNKPEELEAPTLAPTGDESLEDVLIDLAKWGKPRVGQYGSDGTWHCSVEVSITPIGAKFEVRSDFERKSPLDAAKQCRKNLLVAVNSIKRTS